MQDVPCVELKLRDYAWRIREVALGIDAWKTCNLFKACINALRCSDNTHTLSIRAAELKCVFGAEGEASQRMESLERYRDNKRRRLFSGAKTIRYEKRKVNADRR